VLIAKVHGWGGIVVNRVSMVLKIPSTRATASVKLVGVERDVTLSVLMLAQLSTVSVSVIIVRASGVNCAMIRDVRAWHGGTPNLSSEVRAIPNVEYLAPWYREPLKRSMPRDLYQKLSDRGQYLARYIVAETEAPLDIGYRSSLGGTPTGF
jgi:hypothetical protein